MTSGSLLVMSATPCSLSGPCEWAWRGSVGLQCAGDLLERLHGALGLRVHLLELLTAHHEGDGADDAPEDRDDERGETGVHHVLQRPPEGEGQEQQHHVAGE